MKVWTVSMKSESGDDYGTYVFAKKPTQKKLKEIVRSIPCDGEDEDGPGAFGSYLHLSEPTETEVL